MFPAVQSALWLYFKLRGVLFSSFNPGDRGTCAGLDWCGLMPWFIYSGDVVSLAVVVGKICSVTSKNTTIKECEDDQTVLAQLVSSDKSKLNMHLIRDEHQANSSYVQSLGFAQKSYINNRNQCSKNHFKICILQHLISICSGLYIFSSVVSVLPSRCRCCSAVVGVTHPSGPFTSHQGLHSDLYLICRTVFSNSLNFTFYKLTFYSNLQVIY